MTERPEIQYASVMCINWLSWRYSPVHCPLQQASYSHVHFCLAKGCDQKFALNNYRQRHSTAKGSDYGEKGGGRAQEGAYVF